MSAHYRPVLWNPQKRIYDGVMLGLMALYLLLFAALQLLFYPEITEETLIIRATGTLAYLMLHVILVIGPLTRLNPYFMPLLYNRRHLGVTMFLISLVHGAFNVVQFHALGNVDPLVSVFVSNLHYPSLGNFPFQVPGFFALFILFVMAATSHDFWLKNLSPRVWKSLHMMVYAAYALLTMHVMLGIVQLESAPAWVALPGAGLLVVIGFHLAAAFVEQRRTYQPQTLDNEGFVSVCLVEDIQESCAKMVLIGEENIAIFKYEGKVSAVSNVCRHQNGPLGEGKIIDGCITCPWHGYQYLPHNGQSPPPFTEKLETYDVRIVEGQVYVHPRPYPEGTERPPALISASNSPLL
ncbi:MAG: (2Fe-2S)-binding protein [Bacteroidetes bacterium]|nr:MAG: (2Fe-2S)-binding protein [Bacteroidota bacterium]